jgi:hypothetical protein
MTVTKYSLSRKIESDEMNGLNLGLLIGCILLSIMGGLFLWYYVYNASLNTSYTMNETGGCQSYMCSDASPNGSQSAWRIVDGGNYQYQPMNSAVYNVPPKTST